MRRYVEQVLRWRALVLLGVALVSLLAGLSLTRAVIASSPKKLFFGNSPAYKAYVERTRYFAGDELILIGVASPKDLLAAEQMSALQKAHEALEALDFVAHVQSLPGASLIQAGGGGLKVERVGDLLADAPERRDEVARQLVEDPLYKGLLLGPDGRSTVFVVETVLDEDRSAEEVPELVEAAVAAVTSVGLPREHLHLQGIPAVMAECVALAQQSLGVLTPIVVALLLLIVWLLFRQLWPVLVTGSVAAIGTLWTMGFAVALDPEVNIMLSGVPAIIMIISFSDVVHLCSAYMQLIGDGLAKEEAIRQAGEEVGVACLLTSVTTFCGFAAMMLVPTPVMQQLGLVAGFGVGIALLIALTLVPVMFLYLPTPSPPPREAASSRLLSAVVGLCERVATTRPWAVILGFALLFTISVVGLTQLTIETEFNKRLAEGNHLNVADRFFKETFSGVQPVDLILEAEPGRFKEPATLAAVDGAQRAIAKRPEIGRAVSVTDLLRRIHGTMGGGRGALPSTRPMTAQYLLLFEMGGGQDLNKLITPDADRMRVAMFLPGTGFRGVARIGEEAADSMRLALGEGVKVHVNSISHLFGEWLVEILAGQRRGLLASSTVIMLLMMLGLRSVRVGAWSMVPNLLPIIALGGLLGLVYDQVDSDVLMVALIGLGIGVDDTVHFLMRLRIESRKHADPREAIRATFEFAGKPIVKTTLILGLGFAPMALSGYWSLSIMGTLLPFTLVVALLADLLLVPALVQVRAIRFS